MNKIEMDTFQARNLAHRVRARAWDSQITVLVDGKSTTFRVGKLNHLINNRPEGLEISIRG